MALIDYHKIIQEGFDNLNRGNNSRALNLAKSVIKKKYNIDAFMLAGLALYNLEDYSEANEYLSKAYKERKNHEIIELYYFQNLKKLGFVEEAILSLNKISKINKKLLPLAIEFYEKDGNYKKALNLVITMDDNIVKYEALSWIYEHLNKIKDAKKAVNQGLILSRSSYKLNLVAAKIYLREKKYSKAKKQLKNIIKSDLSNRNLSILYSIKAQCLEGQNKYKKAFNIYTKSNNCLIKTNQYKNLIGKNFYTFEMIEKIKTYFNHKLDFNPLINCDEDITFMVGLPRSGTTLLENILNAHSQITTIEEKPTVDFILKDFLMTKDGLKSLEKISREDIKVYQSKYIQIRNQYVKDNSKIIIDKLPLNYIQIGILYRIFPNAKFIVSIRDIRDVAISCFFQNFAINDAMAYFLDWKTTMKYLQEIRSLGKLLILKYPVQNKVVKYEKFVRNPKKTIENLIDFLGLDWEDSIMDYRKNIAGKNITTPSYSSITKKININRVQRWKNYKKYF